jgi:signal transduction histidine kinase
VSSTVLTGRTAEGRRPWAPARADVWLAGAMAAASAEWVLVQTADPEYRPGDLLAVLLAVAAASGLLWRQAAPLAAMAGTGLLVVANAAAGYVVGPVQWPMWMALFTCYAVGGRRLRAAAAAVAVLALAGYVVLDRGTPVAELPAIAIIFLFAVIAGELSSRRARAAAAEARRAEDSDRRALVAERLLLQERTRLARELHDSLGHTVNVMVLQAGVGRRVFAENPEFAHDALASIETVGRGALEELDRLLKVLQPDEGNRHAVPFAPTPADLEELAGRIRATGRQVDLLMDGVALPDSCARALYRIVQEALTNAVRHTSAGHIRVEVTRDGDRVVADVLNEGACFGEPVPGRGLVNMRERARLEGGSLEAGPVEGGFRVRAVLPAGSAVTA